MSLPPSLHLRSSPFCLPQNDDLSAFGSSVTSSGVTNDVKSQLPISSPSESLHSPPPFPVTSTKLPYPTLTITNACMTLSFQTKPVSRSWPTPPTPSPPRRSTPSAPSSSRAPSCKPSSRNGPLASMTWRTGCIFPGKVHSYWRLSSRRRGRCCWLR